MMRSSILMMMMITTMMIRRKLKETIEEIRNLTLMRIGMGIELRKAFYMTRKT